MANLKTRTLQKSYQTTHDLLLSHLTNINGFYQNQQGLFFLKDSVKSKYLIALAGLVHRCFFDIFGRNTSSGYPLRLTPAALSSLVSLESIKNIPLSVNSKLQPLRLRKSRLLRRKQFKANQDRGEWQNL